MRAAFVTINARLAEAYTARDLDAYLHHLHLILVKEFGGWKYATTKESGIRYRQPKNPQVVYSEFPERTQHVLELLLSVPQFRLNKGWYSFEKADRPSDDLWRVDTEDLAVFAKTCLEYEEVFKKCPACRDGGGCEIHEEHGILKFREYSEESSELLEESRWFSAVISIMVGLFASASSFNLEHPVFAENSPSTTE